MYIISNGKLTKKATLDLSVFDRGHQLGEGLFETIRVKKGSALSLKQHWQRLATGADLLKIRVPFSFIEFKEYVRTLINQNKLIEAGIRLTLTGGISERGLTAIDRQQPTFCLTSFTFKKLRSVRLCFSTIASEPSNPLSQVKSLSYLTNILVKQQAVTKGFDDAIRQNPQGYITETSSANIFMLKSNCLYTPKASDGLLAGIMRAELIDYAKGSHHLELREMHLTRQDLLGADGLFICNRLQGCVPVAQVESTMFVVPALVEKLIAEFN